MRLSVLTDYSFRVLLYAAEKEEQLVTTTEVGEYYNISYNHLVKVVHKLSTAGFLKIKKGRGGGFTLARPADEIFFSDVVKVVEPDFNLVECFDLDSNKCEITSFCKVKGHFSRALGSFFKELDKVCLSDVSKEMKRKW